MVRKKVLLSLCVLVLGMALMENLLGRFGRVPPRTPSDYQIRAIRLRDYAPHLDTFRRPDAAYLKMTDSLEVKNYRLRTDAHGFIRPGAEHQHPDIGIIFLGGSSTECVFVDETNRFPARAGQLLENQLGLSINAYNSGFSGNSTMHSLDVLLNKVIPLHPDIAVLSHAINDLVILIYDGTYWNTHPTRSLLFSFDRRPTLRQLAGIPWRLFPRLHAHLGMWWARFTATAESADEFFHHRDQVVHIKTNEIIEAYGRSLEMFIAICRVNGITPVLMTQQNRIQAEPDDHIRVIAAEKLARDFQIPWTDFQATYAAMQERMRAIASEHEVLLVDLDGEIPKSSTYIYDLVHLNDTGSRRAADYIAQAMTDLVRTIHQHKMDAAPTAE